MFRHPKYYKELRKRNKEIGKARPCVREAALISNSDQVISPRVATATARRAPGPGLKLRHGGLTPEASSTKLQAREDSTANSTRGRVAEPQASSSKQQASSRKRLEAVK